MKRTLCCLLILAILMSFSGCQKASTLKMKETASTELVDFTLEDCTLTHYVDNTINDDYLMATEEKNEIYGASMGRCFVSLTFTINNKDRAGSIDFIGSEWRPGFFVKYDGKKYIVKGFDLNYDNASFDLSPAAIVDNTSKKLIRQHTSTNYLLAAEEQVTIRTFGIIDVEPESLKDGFDLGIKLPNVGGGYTKFVYNVLPRE